VEVDLKSQGTVCALRHSNQPGECIAHTVKLELLLGAPSAIACFRFRSVFGIRWRVPMFRLVQLAVGVALISFGSPLWAAEIRWFGEDTCRRELEVTAQIESMTGRPISTVEIADFELNLKSLAHDQWSLDLTTVRRAAGARSMRTIHGATCVDVTDAAAVAIALAIGPSEPPPASKNEAKPEQNAREATPPPKPAPATGKAPVTQSSFEWSVGLAAALDSSATPSLAAGGALHVGMSWLPTYESQTLLRFELEGALYAPTETSNVAGQAGKFQLGYVAPLVCGAKPLGVTLLACAGYEFGQLWGEGVGVAVTTSHPSNTFWSAVRAELGLLVPLGTAWRFDGRAGLAVPLERREFVLDGTDVVFRPASASARVELGVELSL
jgi:hypothetical protein